MEDVGEGLTVQGIVINNNGVIYNSQKYFYG